MEKLRNLVSKLNNVSMKKKLLISYILVVLLPVLLVGLILTGGMRDMALEQAVNDSRADVDRTVKRMSEICQLATEVSDKIYMTPNLMEMLTKKYETDYEVFVDYMSNPELDIYLGLNSNEIEDIRLYSYNDTLLNNSRFIPVERETLDFTWFKKAIAGKGRIYWNYNFNEQKGRSFLSMTRLVRDPGMKPLGVLVIDISQDFFHSFLSDQQFDTIIVDDENKLVAVNDSSYIGQDLSVLELDIDLDMVESEDENSVLYTDNMIYKGKPSMAIVRSFSPDYSDSTLKVISIFETSAIMARVTSTVYLGAFIMSASILLSLVLVVLFSGLLSKRVKQLSKDIHIVTSGNFDVEMTVAGEDEIGRLSKDLQFMIQSIKGLMHEVYEVNLQKQQLVIQQKEIKLRMLANQINPHFLFNVLETVRSKANCIGAAEIVQIVKQLGKILRSNLEIESESIFLLKELDIVKSYLEIQKYRFKDKIEYEINVCDDIGDYKTMPFIIQPIVENAVVHGIENKLGKGRINIEIRRSEEFLRTVISDNGEGMDEERLKAVLKSLEEQEYDPNRRVGLRNVYQRIKLHYGEKYGLEIKSKPGEGTTIDILLPGRSESYA